MSGHSKWHNIQATKNKADAARGKIFTKIGREIAVAVKLGGPDPNTNSKLYDVIQKAKQNNMPNDNIQRSIKKAAGESNAENYVSIIYEGYGPNGVAFIVDCLTDNKNRTASDVRHLFTHHGGNLGSTGSVMYNFDYRGVIVLDKEGLSEDDVMMVALDAGADDFNEEEDCYEILTSPEEFDAVNQALADAGVTFASAEITMIPQTTVDLTSEDDIKKMNRILGLLDEDDDVQNVYHNWNEPEEDEE